MMDNEDDVEWVGDGTSGRPDWRAKVEKRTVKLFDMQKYFSAFSSALESLDLFPKKGPGCGEQSVTHNWQALVDGLQRVVLLCSTRRIPLTRRGSCCWISRLGAKVSHLLVHIAWGVKRTFGPISTPIAKV